jgi:periplasmic protein TonB
MEAKTYDWKDVANAKFDKAFTLALLVLLFGVMVSPKVEIQKQQYAIQQMQAVDLPPEEREKIKPPEDIVKPVIDIIISDELAGNDITDPNVKEALLKQMDVNVFDTNISKNNSDRPFEFVPYEDPPEPINPIAPTYPDFAKRTGIQGVVILEVDVYRDGTLGKINVKKSLLSGPGGLDEAAIDAVKKWRFQPGKSGGKPIDTTVIIPIEFTLTK